MALTVPMEINSHLHGAALSRNHPTKKAKDKRVRFVLMRLERLRTKLAKMPTTKPRARQGIGHRIKDDMDFMLSLPTEQLERVKNSLAHRSNLLCE